MKPRDMKPRDMKPRDTEMESVEGLFDPTDEFASAFVGLLLRQLDGYILCAAIPLRTHADVTEPFKAVLGRVFANAGLLDRRHGAPTDAGVFAFDAAPLFSLAAHFYGPWTLQHAEAFIAQVASAPPPLQPALISPLLFSALGALNADVVQLRPTDINPPLEIPTAAAAAEAALKLFFKTDTLPLALDLYRRAFVVYALLLSYAPLLRCLHPLASGRVLLHPPPSYDASRGEPPAEGGGMEWHVARGLNVRATTAALIRLSPVLKIARDAFFERVLLRLFDAAPLDEQPSFVADVGCGDGSMLKEVFNFISANTRRGAALKTHPLLLIAADISEAALAAARRSLGGLGGVLFLRADVGRPFEFKNLLAAHGLKAEAGLHVRAFLDHNRPLLAAPPRSDGPPEALVGPYLGGGGEAVSRQRLWEDFVCYLLKWGGVCGSFGIVTVDHKTRDDSKMAAKLGRLRSLDSLHALTGQFLVEEGFTRAALDAAGFKIKDEEVTPELLFLHIAPRG
jgi:hypothetical protein